jgi:predicted alpha/beta superfamily hydrolase
MRIIVTGHSLGGGLVLFAVLRNPGVEGVAFNPVGLS